MQPIQGEFYKGLMEEWEKRRDPAPEYLKAKIIEVIEKLLTAENGTDVHKPGMLLGKIQSGKTRAFIGAIALAFDNGYDMTIVLTKGTNALTKQTYERLKRDFYSFFQNDKVEICDIMHLPRNYTGYELHKKLIIVVKKETNNMRRIIEALVTTYPDLRQRKLLIIDDEADYASIGFRMNRNEGIIEINKIAEQINELREKIASYDFLQVTATPYSLYLQPEELRIEESRIFKPVRPAFTVLLPTYEGYIGGEYYFDESENERSAAFYVYEPVSKEELEILRAGGHGLRRADRRSFRLEEVLESSRMKALRRALMNFIVGACIRRIQEEELGQPIKKYSFIVHTEPSRASHSWQEEIVNKIKEVLSERASSNPEFVEMLIQESYNDLQRSILVNENTIPLLENIKQKVFWVLQEDCLMITKVNSEKDAEELLDENGQLRLRAPLNIFIGGQILDRGLTIDNLIGFYYGRRPQRFQQDTVLQHSRMYGNRSAGDLAVTRFYTAPEIYDAMRRIHELDTALREAFERGAQEAGVAFIHTDPFNKVMPCSPNKILLSSTTTLRPYKRLLPVGFQTEYKTNVKNVLEKIDSTIDIFPSKNKIQEDLFLVEIQTAKSIIDDIAKMLSEEGILWDVRAFNASMEYLSQNTDNEEQKGKIFCLVRKDRNMSRTKADGSFSNQPDNPETDRPIAVKYAIDIPILMLFRQNGLKEQGWKDCPFWWPVLVAPKNTKTVIYSSNLIEVQQDLVS